MFGIMGLSAAFAKAASAKGKKNELRFSVSVQDPSLSSVSCSGDISVNSIKDGESIVQTYNNLNNAQLSIQSDANTEIVIIGDLTKCHFSADPGVGCMNLTNIDASKCLSLTNVSVVYNAELTSIDLSDNINLTNLYCRKCTTLSSIKINKNLTYLNCNDCVAISDISYPATNNSVSTTIAGAITAATAADGTVYTDSQGAYYSTIADAATAKGWTIEQLS